jgi:prepilin peptidase CpaA
LISILDLSIIALASLAVFFDLTVRRIPNWLILAGLALAILINASQGLGPFTQSVLGFVLGIAVLIVPFALGWLGAGDVKYFAVVGAFLGIAWLPRVAFYMTLAAGAMALGHVAVNSIRIHLLKGIWTDFRLAIISFGHILPPSIRTRADKGSHTVPWAVAISAGTIIAYYLDPRGQWAGF